jgi:DNA repair exonuclease SbcCD ATPase subunit
MANKRIWLTKKQIINRVITATIIIAILIVIGLLIFRPSGEIEQKTITEPEPEAQGQIESLETLHEDEEEIEAEVEEPETIRNSCKIDVKHAEDEVLDAYNIKRKAENKLADLQTEITELQKEIAEADDLLEDSEEALDDLKESCKE